MPRHVFPLHLHSGALVRFMAERATGSAWRTMERRLRPMLRHERPTVAVALAEAQHHSAQKTVRSKVERIEYRIVHDLIVDVSMPQVVEASVEPHIFDLKAENLERNQPVPQVSSQHRVVERILVSLVAQGCSQDRVVESSSCLWSTVTDETRSKRWLSLCQRSSKNAWGGPISCSKNKNRGKDAARASRAQSSTNF